MLAIFENFSQTGMSGKLVPLLINQAPTRVFDTIVKYLNDDGYCDIKTDKTFLEIFCTDGPFEMTVVIIGQGDGTSLLNISVYCETKRGKTRKRLRNFMHEIDDLFE